MRIGETMQERAHRALARRVCIDPPRLMMPGRYGGMTMTNEQIADKVSQALAKLRSAKEGRVSRHMLDAVETMLQDVCDHIELPAPASHSRRNALLPFMRDRLIARNPWTLVMSHRGTVQTLQYTPDEMTELFAADQIELIAQGKVGCDRRGNRFVEAGTAAVLAGL